MKRDDTKKNFTPLSGNDLQTVRFHYPSFPCIIAIVPISRLLNLMRYSSVLNTNIRIFCSENRNFYLKNMKTMKNMPQKACNHDSSCCCTRSKAIFTLGKLLL